MHEPGTGPRPAHIAVEPTCWRREQLADAVISGGGTITTLADATALIWADPNRPDSLPEYTHDGIDWVQLPFAGIEPFIHLLDHDRLWTCGKGVYARPVAEHALALTLAGLHHLGPYAGATSWSGPVGRNLDGCRVLILGGGGITQELVGLLAPWECEVVVLRRTPTAMTGVDRVGTLAILDEELPAADVVVLALAVTDETIGVIGHPQLDAMSTEAWLVNVARGAHVDTDALVTALRSGSIAGAALDVTDPEPLPDAHPLWELDNCLITPHVGNTPQVGLDLLARRVTENTRRYIAGERLLGPVDLDAGY